MNEYENKYLDSTGVKHLWDKAGKLYVKQEDGKGLSEENYSAEEKEKLAGLENYELPTASDDKLGGIKIGEGLKIDEDGVVHIVYNPETPVDWDVIEDTPTTLEGYGITDAATKDELEDVKTAITRVYKYKGSVNTVADLDLIAIKDNGDTYDVKEDGTNYAWNEDESRWDALGTTVKIEALSNYELDIITGSASSEKALQDLIAEGGDVELGANITLTEPLTVSKDTVLDLNGFKLGGNLNGYALVADKAKLTLKNGVIQTTKRIASADNGGEVVIQSGTYTSGDVAFAATGEGSKVVFVNGELTAQEGGIGAFDKGEIEVKGGTITGIDNFAVFTNGTAGRGGNKITIDGGELVGNITSANYEACGIYIANNDTLVVNGGTIKANGGCGILMRAGNVTINGGEVIATTGSHVPGWVGDNKVKMSASAVIYHESANYPGKAGMSLTINDGVFVGADHSVEVLSNETTPNVHINGGQFTPPV